MSAAANPPALRGAIIGCGFWAASQVAAWRELEGVELVAVCDRSRARANSLADAFAIPAVYEDAETLLAARPLDFVDIITNVETHAALAQTAIRHGVNAIVQKPMAPDWETAQAMVQAAHAAGVRLLVHENFRWQAPLRRVRELLDQQVIGPVFKARLSFCSAFSVFDNQPALARLPRFILMDVGTHVLDVARFLLGEASTVYCRTQRVNPTIAGEDVADALLTMHSGAVCFVEMSYASLREQDSFPDTLVLLEGPNGSLELRKGGQIVVTTRRDGSGQQTRYEAVTPAAYAWVDPAYAAVQSSLVDCNRNLLAGLRGDPTVETTGDDNLRTLQLVFACYDSAERGEVVAL